MSIPKNHHHVSQCQIGNFFNTIEGKIYLYDKALQNPFHRKSTERVFSEDFANSRFTDDELDHSTLEKDLMDNFEDTFTPYFNEVKRVVLNPNEASEEFHKALIGLTKYGIAGEIRNPIKKKNNDTEITDALFKQILPIAAPELQSELLALKERTEKTKYTNALRYSEFTEKVFEAMRGVSCSLFVIECEHYFILPDRPSITKRERINEYFYPDIKEIAMVGIPLSSKIYLHSESKKLRNYTPKIFTISEKNSAAIDQINLSLYLRAYKQVACESKDYLQSFINRVENLKSEFL